MTFSDARHKSQIDLTQKDMLEISQEISRKFAPNVTSAAISDSNGLAVDHGNIYTRRPPGTNDKKITLHSRKGSRIGLSTKELHEISEQISRQFMPDISTSLPELFLLPVDPYHLYAYWDLGEKKRSLLPYIDAGNCLTLRIYWRPDENTGRTGSKVWFDVAVYDLEARQKVRLPIDGTAYSAAIGKLGPDNNFDIDAISNIIRVPPAKMRMAPGRRQDEKAMHMARPKAAFPVHGAPHHAVAELFNEETFIKSELTDILYKKSDDEPSFPEKEWFAKFHFSDQAAHHYDDAKIDSKLMNLLNEKGIDIQLLPEPFFFEASNFWNKNASGQGI